MDVNRFYLTKAGLELEGKCKTGAPLIFTHVAVGSGVIRDVPQLIEMITLVEEQNRFPIDHVKNNRDGTATIHAMISNREIKTGYHMREIGVLAQDPELGEILYAVCPAGEYTEWLSASTERQLEVELEAIIVTGNAENLHVTIDNSMVYATKAELLDLAGKGRTVETVVDNAERLLRLELQMLVLSGSTAGFPGNKFMVSMEGLTDEEDFGGVYFRESKELCI